MTAGKTVPELTAETPPIVGTDELVVYRAPGPLKRTTASVLGTYVNTVIGTAFTRTLLATANNSAFLTALGQIASSFVDFIQSGTGAVQRTLQEKIRSDFSVNIRDFGAVCDGATSDVAAINAAIAACPVGGRVEITGLAAVLTPIVITKQVSLWCPTAKDALYNLTGPGNIPLTYSGGAGGLGQLDVQLNIYGPADGCTDVVLLDRVDSAKIKIGLYCGATGVGVRLRGCLQNRVQIDVDANTPPPISQSVGLPTTGFVLIEKNTTHNVTTNACDIYLNLAGGAGYGLKATAQSGESLNSLHGTIQGMTGRALDLDDQSSFDISTLWMEVNGTAPLISSGRGTRVASTLLYAADGPKSTMVVNGGIAHDIQGLVYGDVVFDANAVAPVYGGNFTRFPDYNPVRTSWYDSAEQVRPTFAIDDPADFTPERWFGGDGMAGLENLYANPFFDIWPDGTSAPSVLPPGMALTSAAIYRVASNTFPQANGFACDVGVAGTGSSSAGIELRLSEPDATWEQNRVVSFMLAIRVANGEPDPYIFVGTESGSVNTPFRRITEKASQWVVVRGGFPVASGEKPAIRISPFDGSTWVSGGFTLGAVNIVNGVRAPKYLTDSQQRRAYVVPAIAEKPTFEGQIARVGSTFYMAKGTASSADWVAIN